MNICVQLAAYLTEMIINRLSQDQVERLVEQVTGGRQLPAEVLQQLLVT
jgi:hypothetical protein